MSAKPEYDRGFKAGIRVAVTWLHNRAGEMNDWRARDVLNAAGFNLGTAYSEKVAKLRAQRAAKAPPSAELQSTDA